MELAGVLNTPSLLVPVTSRMDEKGIGITTFTSSVVRLVFAASQFIVPVTEVKTPLSVAKYQLVALLEMERIVVFIGKLV